MGNQAVVLRAHRPSDPECADMDLRKQVLPDLESGPVPFTCVPSHRDVSEAVITAMVPNDEVDK